MITQYYQNILQKPGFAADPAQAEVVKTLQQSFDLLENPATTPSLTPTTPLSLYIWGKPGRGKSFLMDAFYQCLSTTKKRRVHFYRFMQDIHLQLAEHQGHCDPLIDIANKI